MKARRVKKLDPAAPLVDNSARIVRVRLDELRSFAPRALEPSEARAQHDMRIAAKRLRYVLEVTGFCFGKPAETARKRAKDLQEILGEMHDCDVMLPRVTEHIAELRSKDAAAVSPRAGRARDLDPKLAARAPHRTAYRGLEVLAVYLEARRELLFRRFREFWQKHERASTWEALDRAAAGHLEAERRAARAKAKLEAAEQAERDAADRAERRRREREEAARMQREAAEGVEDRAG